MAEQIKRFQTIEQARNAAIKWLEERNVQFGPHRKIEIGRLGVLKDKEIGVSSHYQIGVRVDQRPYWRIRLDYDPDKGPHFNTEFNTGPARQKAAFLFFGTESLIETLAKSRDPR